MLPLTASLVTKAEMALATAEREMAVQERPNHGAVCLHSERCAERYLKARLVEAGIAFPESTRHLVVLLQLCLDLDPEWELYRHHLRTLTTRGFQVDDPQTIMGRDAARECLDLGLEFRAAVRSRLGLPS